MIRTLFAALLLSLGAVAQDYDLIIRNARVLDGTGNPWFRADIAVKDGRIARTGSLGAATARRIIEAESKYVTPGFIDLHSHNLETDASGDGRFNIAMVAQGITLSVINQDGRNAIWPISRQRGNFEKLGVGNNLILLVGHGSARHFAMKARSTEKATDEDLRAMRAYVEEGMRDGAWGLSAGLEYDPGRFSDTRELIELVRTIKPYGGVYISHERSEGRDPMWKVASDPAPAATLIDAVLETIDIGRQTGATVVCSHIKAKGANYWGSSRTAVRLIQEARDAGVAVYADQYPYDSSGTDGTTVLIPLWSLVAPGEKVTSQLGAAGIRRDGGMAKDNLSTRLANPDTAARIRLDIAREIERRGGAGRVVIHEFPDSRYVGKSLAWLAQDRKLSVEDAVIWMQLNGASNQPGGARLRGHSISEDDIEYFMQQDFTATSTDGAVRILHPRSWGSFPRRIRYYTFERNATTLPFAIRAMTSLPAQILGLKDRGVIREGNWADLVIFDPAAIRDTGTFEDPSQLPKGIDFVFVNGQAVVDGGKPTQAVPGKVLRLR